ncbi:MAG: hypothetical protein GC155_07400 [Alphaproteobacteria bacterium]|nr:hypothetical protein [Alphaproteobacteria bacterium]
MATQQTGESRGGSNGFLYFAVGALIVAVGVLGFMYYSNHSSGERTMERNADKIGNAAQDLGDAAKDAAKSIPAPSQSPQPVQPAPTDIPAN